MTTVYLTPRPENCSEDNGIGRVVITQREYLPHLGITLVDHPADAEVFASHGFDEGLPRVDVLHLHGMYWTGDPFGFEYGQWHHSVNAKIVEAARKALLITVPSHWVAEAFKRDMRIRPLVVGHGIEDKMWHPQKDEGYILWNKNRNTDVCDPSPALDIAFAGHLVWTTLLPAGKESRAPATIKVLGLLPFAQMKKVVQGAHIYLATTQETFGIGTLEALASGVPVLGYNWGGTRDLVKHKVNGYLVEPGDFQGLLQGIEWINHNREEMGRAAQKSALQYTWDRVMRLYAGAYITAGKRMREEKHRVTVVIPCYNYADYVCEAVQSALDQTVSPDEVIVVDDGSKDDSVHQVNARFSNEPRVRLLPQKNAGVAAARNLGIRSTESEYIICLDADDKLMPQCIEMLLPAMKAQRDLGIAYGGLTMLNVTREIASPHWPPEFSWRGQSQITNPPSNAIPTVCMFRRSMWERCGGYQQEWAPGEDAEFWLRGLSVGFKAERVTQYPTFWYRLHQKSASRNQNSASSPGAHSC